MSVSVVETKDPRETEALGAELAADLQDGDVVLVQGELGSGKTTFVRGAARALGVTDPDHQPDVQHRTSLQSHETRPSRTWTYTVWQGVCEQEDPALLDDYLGPGTDRFRGVAGAGHAELSSARLRVTLSHRGADRRRIEVVQGMIVLGFDTATSSTAVALRLGDGSTLQARDDPGQDERPGHATRLLGMADELLGRASIGWRALERIAVGLGPGTFTGLRVGVATARGLAQSLEIELVGVSSLRALAEPALRSERDGSTRARGLGCTPRRGVPRRLRDDRGGIGRGAHAATRAGSRGSGEHTRASQDSARKRSNAVPWRAIGDGAVRFRAHLQAAGVMVPPDSSPLHLLSAEAICDLGSRAETLASYQAIVPDYRRRPDAEIALERRK